MIIAWFGLLLQFGLMINDELSEGNTFIDGLISYFGYFTIITNITTASFITAITLWPSSNFSRFLSKPLIFGGVVISILFIGVAYHFLLHDIYFPEGLGYLSNLVLHYVTPAGVVLYWFLNTPKQRMLMWFPLAWCLYPMLYLVYILIRGVLINKYPYFFIDVTEIGYTQTVINSLFLAFAYISMSYMLILISYLKVKWISKKEVKA